MKIRNMNFLLNKKGSVGATPNYGLVKIFKIQY